MIRKLSIGQRGVAAVAMLIVMTVMAVPVSYASSKLAGQFSRGSQIYENVTESEYSASAGIEYAVWNILHVPTFDSSLTQAFPTADLEITTNGQPVAVTVTKIFGHGGTTEGGSGASVVVDAPLGFDILSQAGNKSIKTRVHYYKASMQIDVLSWQVK